MAPQKGRTRKPHRKLKSAAKNPATNSILSIIQKNESKATGKDQPRPARFMPPAPTDVLDDVGVKEWQRVCELLADDGLLTELDTSTLMLYCDAFSDFHKAVAELKKENNQVVKTGKKNGGQFRNPWYDIKKKAAAEMNAYSVLLGFSPHDRARIKRTAVTPPGGAPANEFDNI